MDAIDLTAKQRKLIGQRLEAYGAKREAGAACGCSGQHINQIVSGANRPSREVLARLCKHLGLTLIVTVQITVD